MVQKNLARFKVSCMHPPRFVYTRPKNRIHAQNILDSILQCGDAEKSFDVAVNL